ncbi:hypothetical protein, variant [Phytophthora nicotianae]|uniref:Uncharacterized protein n=1 Tax=Phytophthora nicotianae TaxID=4792 RepID=W2GW39_PHYNI|nr:hypothetical protein, variant [Phytophthora nicotianae]
MSCRWNTANTSSALLPAGSASICQDLLLTEKKRKAKEEAVRDLNKGGNCAWHRRAQS